MVIEQNGIKRSVVIEGVVERIDGCPIIKSVGKETDSYQFRVRVEFDSTTKAVVQKAVYCRYYVRHDDSLKQGSIKLISSLLPKERIICYGVAAGTPTVHGEAQKDAPLYMIVHSFLLPDRVNALLASLTACEETAIRIEDGEGFELEQKANKAKVRRSIQASKTKTKKKQGKEKPKYAFD